MGETDIDELIKKFDKDSNSLFDKVGLRWGGVYTVGAACCDIERSKAFRALWG